MPSPFPGMDPFLEQDSVWPTFHYHLVNTLFQVVVPGLLERYRARVAERTYVVEQVLFTSVQTEDHREPFLEVRTRGDGKLVTLLEVISPTNKCTAAGRQAYRDRRQDAIRNKANVVEIDLVLQGASVHDFSRESLPAWDYSVVVSRTPRPEQYELYTATIDKRLPRFRMPLAPDDRDTVVDLQAVVHRVHEQGDFDQRIDYQRGPAVPLTDEQRQWIDHRLKEQKVRP